jgi:hypothetical protein
MFVFGVRLSDAVGVPSFDAPCTLTTGMGVSRFASESELEPIAEVQCRCRLLCSLLRQPKRALSSRTITTGS